MRKYLTKMNFLIIIIGLVGGFFLGTEYQKANDDAKEFTTQSITQYCPELPFTTLGDKNITLSDGTDLTAVFGKYKQYILLTVGKTECTLCKEKAHALNRDTEIQTLLGENSTCGFISLAGQYDVEGWKAEAGGFVATHTKGYEGNGRAWNVLKSLGKDLAFSNTLDGAPRFALMKRDGTYVDENITDLKKIITEYCTMCPMSGETKSNASAQSAPGSRGNGGN